MKSIPSRDQRLAKIKNCGAGYFPKQTSLLVLEGFIHYLHRMLSKEKSQKALFTREIRQYLNQDIFFIICYHGFNDL